MVQSSNESQQTQTFSIDHENVLPDHYRLIELIGRGGMAEVYLGEDRRLGRKVAIKFLNPEFRRDPDRVRRFRQEARSASALTHPNILIIHDIGDSGGVQFIVSELVEGETLGTRIAQGKLSFAEAVDIAIQAASALTAAHAAGIVHRDIKPDNVMIRHDGVVKVLDFGLAKARGFTTLNGGDFDALTIDSGSTSPGLIVGTPQYMSPEQARGKELDGRTDIFSLGIIIFEMVTRHSPFASGCFADTMAAILTKEPRRLDEFVEDAPPRLFALINKCLKKQRDERFASMAEVETELKLLRGELVASPRATAEVDPINSDRTQIRRTEANSIRRFVSDTFRRRSPMAAVIILLAAGLLVGGWWAWGRISLQAAAPSLMRTVPITSWSSSASELVTSASFSPDGKMVAFSARKGDSTEIWVKPVVGGDPVQVTKNGGYNQYPIWSPDGQELLFFSDRGANWGIWKIPFTGGDTTKALAGVEQTARPILWTRDGEVYFQSKRELFRSLKGEDQAEQLTHFGEAGIAVGTIQISDNENLLAYSEKTENGWKIKIRQLEDGAETDIASSHDQIDYLAWHPNNRDVFASFSVDGSLQVFEANVDSDSAVQRSNGDINFVVHDVSTNGSVLYGTLSETADMWRVDTKTGLESIVANEVALEILPSVSAKSEIAFQSGTHVERPDWAAIKIWAGDGAGRLINVSPDGFTPEWSNNGEWIAFFRKSSAGYELWKSRANGIDLAQVTDVNVAPPVFVMAPYLTTSVTRVAWSPDDEYIAVGVRENGKTRLWIAKVNASDTGAFLGRDPIDGANEVNPFWSSDRTAIVSTAALSARAPTRSFTYRIYLTEVSSGARRLLFESSEMIRVLGFSPDGNEVIFAKRLDRLETTPAPPLTEIYSLPVSAGDPRKINTLANAYFHNIHLSKSGDLSYVTRAGDRTAIVSRALASVTEKEHLLIRDPKVLISSLGVPRDGSFIVFGKQTRTNQLSMLAP
ncbi:MAG: protein kinase [bacterium]|nr:protein kinase [bacterium]